MMLYNSFMRLSSCRRNDAKAETPVLWPPHEKSWLIGKNSDARRDWRQEEKGTTEDEMAGWHHGLDGRESEWTPGVGDGQGGLACCDSWGRKESDTTERLNWTELNVKRDIETAEDTSPNWVLTNIQTQTVLWSPVSQHIWSPIWEKVPGNTSALWVRLKIAVQGSCL